MINKYTEFVLIYLENILSKCSDINQNNLHSLLQKYYNDKSKDNKNFALSEIKSLLKFQNFNKKLNGPEFVIQSFFANLTNFFLSYEEIPLFIKENFVIIKLNKKFTFINQILQPQGDFNKDLHMHFHNLETEWNEESFFIEEIFYPDRIILFYYDGARGKKLEYYSQKYFYLGDKVYTITKFIFKNKKGEYFYTDDKFLLEEEFKKNVFRISFAVLENVK